MRARAHTHSRAKFFFPLLVFNTQIVVKGKQTISYSQNFLLVQKIPGP
jgi:hypothetical protein